MVDIVAAVDAAPFCRVTKACSRAAVRNEMMALRDVTLSVTGPRVSATAEPATAAAITVARVWRAGRTRAKDHTRWPGGSNLQRRLVRRRQAQHGAGHRRRRVDLRFSARSRTATFDSVSSPSGRRRRSPRRGAGRRTRAVGRSRERPPAGEQCRIAAARTRGRPLPRSGTRDSGRRGRRDRGEQDADENGSTASGVKSPSAGGAQSDGGDDQADERGGVLGEYGPKRRVAGGHDALDQIPLHQLGRRAWPAGPSARTRFPRARTRPRARHSPRRSRSPARDAGAPGRRASPRRRRRPRTSQVLRAATRRRPLGRGRADARGRAVGATDGRR